MTPVFTPKPSTQKRITKKLSTKKLSTKKDRPTPMSDAPADLHRTAPHSAVSTDRSTRGLFGIAACGGLLAGAGLIEQSSDPLHLPLFLFFSALALLAVLLPATGPRGQRVGLIPAVGLAALLLLPPLTALLPLLLANTAFAFSREMRLSRRLVFERGLCLLLAIGAGGLLQHFLTFPGALHQGWKVGTLPEYTLTAAVYGAVFMLGRLGWLGRHLAAKRTVRRHAFQNWCLEAVTLVVTAPIVLLMAAVYPEFGMLGLVGAAVLLALMVVVAHFGFEVAGLRQQVRAMETLSAVTVSQTSAPRVIEQFLRLSGALVSCDRVVLWLTDESDIRLERTTPARMERHTAGKCSDGEKSVRFGEGLVGRVAERKKPLLVRDGLHDPRLVAEEQSDSESAFAMLLLPLVAGNQTMGVVQFERDAPGTFTGRDLPRIQSLASQAAATLANVRAHQDVYSQAVTDALTGLYNRRHMQTVLADERRRAQRYSHPLSVIMLDVDGFKNYNDTYGHVQGDVLLKMLSGILQSSVRGVDIVGRFGGEEFIIVLPETPSDEAYQTAERLRLAVAGTVFPGFADDPGLAVFKTISLGVATFPDITHDTQALVTLADNALYRAKRGGRNQTVQADVETLSVERE